MMTTSPAYEQGEAIRFAGLTYDQYMALPGVKRWVDPEFPTRTKAEILAQYRTHMLFEAVKADISAPKSPRRGGR